jgi:primosomal protein N'
MDSDSMRRYGSHDAALEAFRRREVRILLGTQMIAKGLDFPDVTLVGVVSADTSLHHPDFRASERTFQLISQVAGRTGRGPRGGRVFVQTVSPTEPAIRRAAEHDYLGFAADELARRRDMSLPPFVSLVRVILRGPPFERRRITSQPCSKTLGERRACRCDFSAPPQRRSPGSRAIGGITSIWLPKNSNHWQRSGTKPSNDSLRAGTSNT